AGRWKRVPSNQDAQRGTGPAKIRTPDCVESPVDMAICHSPLWKKSCIVVLGDERLTSRSNDSVSTNWKRVTRSCLIDAPSGGSAVTDRGKSRSSISRPVKRISGRLAVVVEATNSSVTARRHSRRRRKCSLGTGYKDKKIMSLSRSVGRSRSRLDRDGRRRSGLERFKKHYSAFLLEVTMAFKFTQSYVNIRFST
ncbi:unnamed protein product, partial [Protopolystoma xenopodis]